MFHPGRARAGGESLKTSPLFQTPPLLSNREQVCDGQHRHEHRRGRDHDPQDLYHALSAHLLLPGSPWLGTGLLFAEGTLATLLPLFGECLVDGPPETLLVTFVIVVLSVLYRTVLDHEQPRHALDVVLGDQLSCRVQEHRVGDIVVARGAVYVDHSEGSPIVLVLCGEIFEAGHDLIGVLVQGAPEGEYVDTFIRELEDPVVHALHPECGSIVAHGRGWLGKRGRARAGLGASEGTVEQRGGQHDEDHDGQTFHEPSEPDLKRHTAQRLYPLAWPLS